MANHGYILGINGWYKGSHDNSACIIKEGKIIAMVEEERFLRKKHAYDKIPFNSILWCLTKAGITLDDIELVATGWDYQKLHQINGLDDPFLNNLEDLYFPKKYFKYSKKPKFVMVDHHLAHAACSYFLSGFNESSIIVIDGQGENMSGTLAVAKGSNIKIIKEFSVKDSLGYFYQAVSEFVGLGSDAPGKLMGLASYGKPIYSFDQFSLSEDGYSTNIHLNQPSIKSLGQQQLVIDNWLIELEKMFGQQNNHKFEFRPIYCDLFRNTTIDKIHQNIAASAQSILEKITLHLTEVVVKETGVRNLCLSGGTALNCSMNTLIANSGLVDNFFVPPMTNDIGTCLGAAMYAGGIKPSSQLENAYLGPEFSNSEIKIVLDKLKCKYKEYSDITVKVADILSQGKIVSWFQGAIEVGPRALGNRSILANPTLKNTNHDVNLAKNREFWRPLAPSILEEQANNYLENSFTSPFMLHTFTVKKSKQKEVPAITHVDGSTRPQTVNKKTNPKYYRLINNFYQKTGTPIVLNTSYNGAKEPIVLTPLDAITSFFSNATDCLAIGDFLIKK